MLGLATGQPEWLQAFRGRLLSEAQKKDFSHSAHSVKFIQYQAALRVYYYYSVKQRFPHLFSSPEDQEIRRWLAAVNRRALTVEWVDWLYALAFSKWPEGPYENQENGAGLLALLEFSGLADPTCSGRQSKVSGPKRSGVEYPFPQYGRRPGLSTGMDHQRFFSVASLPA